MTVRPYRPSDFPQIKEWGAKWGAEYQEDQFPSIGFVVDGIAAYFLYQTDSAVCWLENMVSNRGVPKEEVDRALDLIVDAILNEALVLGYKLAYATTNISKVATRAKASGAALCPNQILIIKNLKKDTELQ